MELKTKERDGVTVVYLEGRLDVHVAVDVERALEGIITGGAAKILANLEKVDYLSSSGLRVFISTMRKLKDRKGKFKLCGLSENVEKIFKVVELVDLFDIHKDENTAIASF